MLLEPLLHPRQSHFLDTLRFISALGSVVILYRHGSAVLPISISNREMANWMVEQDLRKLFPAFKWPAPYLSSGSSLAFEKAIQ